MSSTPQERTTYDIDLSREEWWVVHHVLVRRADELLEAEDTPPNWLVDLFERVEADRETITDRQARQLAGSLARYAAAESTPDRDTDVAARVVETLEASIEG